MATADIGARIERTFFLENPVAGDELPAFFTRNPITLSEVFARVVGGVAPVVTFNVRFDADFEAVAPTDVFAASQSISSETTGTSFTVFAAGTIPAGVWVWLFVDTVTNTPDEVDELIVTLIGDL